MVFTDRKYLVAGNLQQLHSFAEEIGLQRAFFHGKKKGNPHYILKNTIIIEKAITHGAIIVIKKVIDQVAKSSNNHPTDFRKSLTDIWTMNDIILIDAVYYTSDKNYSLGIGSCSDCGSFIDIGVRWCKKCNKETMILKSDKIKPRV